MKIIFKTLPYLGICEDTSGQLYEIYAIYSDTLTARKLVTTPVTYTAIDSIFLQMRGNCIPVETFEWESGSRNAEIYCEDCDYVEVLDKARLETERKCDCPELYTIYLSKKSPIFKSKKITTKSLCCENNKNNDCKYFKKTEIPF